jgi:hypothetical protein
MPAHFVTEDRDTPLLLPPDLRDWVPGNHPVHSIMDAVEQLDLRGAPGVNIERACRKRYGTHSRF